MAAPEAGRHILDTYRQAVTSTPVLRTFDPLAQLIGTIKDDESFARACFLAKFAGTIGPRSQLMLDLARTATELGLDYELTLRGNHGTEIYFEALPSRNGLLVSRGKS